MGKDVSASLHSDQLCHSGHQLQPGTGWGRWGTSARSLHGGRGAASATIIPAATMNTSSSPSSSPACPGTRCASRAGWRADRGAACAACDRRRQWPQRPRRRRREPARQPAGLTGASTAAGSAAGRPHPPPLACLQARRNVCDCEAEWGACPAGGRRQGWRRAAQLCWHHAPRAQRHARPPGTSPCTAATICCRCRCCCRTPPCRLLGEASCSGRQLLSAAAAMWGAAAARERAGGPGSTACGWKARVGTRPVHAVSRACS